MASSAVSEAGSLARLDEVSELIVAEGVDHLGGELGRFHSASGSVASSPSSTSHATNRRSEASLILAVVASAPLASASAV